MRAHRIWVVVIVLLLTSGLCAQASKTQAFSLRDDSHVTPVAGESWLNHINRSFGNTSMGKTWRLGPRPDEDAGFQSTESLIFSSRDGVYLQGSDLYRLNCQGCHGESGLGSPPEINSVINPVRATSVPLVIARMKEKGMDISYADASNLAQQSRAALLDRLHSGGENMPGFPQLNETEIRALLAYLNHLADVPAMPGDRLTVKESHVHVGELIVKSTCHTCHSAVGPNPGPQDLMDGVIPPLSTLITRQSQSEFVRKITQGAPVLMGTPVLAYRGRMPVFFYLTDEEAADVYLYLKLYPPTERTSNAPLVAASMPPTSHSGQGPAPRLPTAGSANAATEEADAARFNALENLAIAATAVMVAFALVGGMVFTFREFKRLSPGDAGHSTGSPETHIDPRTLDRTQTVYRTAPLFFGHAKRSSQ